MHFHGWKYPSFDSNFTVASFDTSVSHKVSTGLDIGLATKRRQAIIRISHGLVSLLIYASFGQKDLTIGQRDKMSALQRRY